MVFSLSHSFILDCACRVTLGLYHSGERIIFFFSSFRHKLFTTGARTEQRATTILSIETVSALRPVALHIAAVDDRVDQGQCALTLVSGVERCEKTTTPAQQEIPLVLVK